MSSISSRPPDGPSHRAREQRGPGPDVADLNDQLSSLSDELAEWVEELRAAGLERRVAHRLTLITVVLVALREMPSFRDDAAEHIEVALADLDTYEAVQIALVEPDFDEVWDALAESTQDPVSGRCRFLARLCRRKGLHVVAS